MLWSRPPGSGAGFVCVCVQSIHFESVLIVFILVEILREL